MTNEELVRWVRDRIDMYLGTVSIDATIVIGLIEQIDTLRELKKLYEVKIEELERQGLVHKDKSTLTIDDPRRSCQYYFKDAHQYCTMKGPHNEHTTQPQHEIIAHALQEKCVRCEFTMSAHINGYCPVGPLPYEHKFLSQKDCT